MNTKAWLICAVLLCLVLSNAAAQRGAIGRELLDAARSFLSREAVSEPLEAGAEVTAARVTQRLAREGGEELVSRAARLTDELGPRTLRVLDDSPSPRKLLDALDALPVAERPSAISAFVREGAPLHEAFESLGERALRAELRHPGVGGRFAATVGEDGARLLDDIDTLDVTVLARHEAEIAALSGPARAQFVGALGRNAKGVADYLRKHPGFALTAATVGILAVESDRAADGIANVFETGADALGEAATTGVGTLMGWLAPGLAVVAVAWIALRLRWRRRRA